MLARRPGLPWMTFAPASMSLRNGHFLKNVSKRIIHRWISQVLCKYLRSIFWSCTWRSYRRWCVFKAVLFSTRLESTTFSNQPISIKIPNDVHTTRFTTYDSKQPTRAVDWVADHRQLALNGNLQLFLPRQRPYQRFFKFLSPRRFIFLHLKRWSPLFSQRMRKKKGVLLLHL